MPALSVIAAKKDAGHGISWRLDDRDREDYLSDAHQAGGTMRPLYVSDVRKILVAILVGAIPAVGFITFLEHFPGVIASVPDWVLILVMLVILIATFVAALRALDWIKGK